MTNSLSNNTTELHLRSSQGGTCNCALVEVCQWLCLFVLSVLAQLLTHAFVRYLRPNEQVWEGSLLRRELTALSILAQVPLLSVTEDSLLHRELTALRLIAQVLLFLAIELEFLR